MVQSCCQFAEGPSVVETNGMDVASNERNIEPHNDSESLHLKVVVLSGF